VEQNFILEGKKEREKNGMNEDDKKKLVEDYERILI
jgi:hypothetical protein